MGGVLWGVRIDRNYLPHFSYLKYFLLHTLSYFNRVV